MGEEMSEEKLYLCLERQTHPSWMRFKCQKPSQEEHPKERGKPVRVWVRIDDVECDVECVGPRKDEAVG
jgi:hypothetical protein